MSRKRIVYSGGSPFYKEMQARVDEHFETTGKDRHANGAMWLKTWGLIAGFFVVYTLYLIFAGPWWQVALFGMVLGAIMAGLGFDVQHDGGHRAYSRKHPWVNRAMAYVLDLLGGSSYMWHWKHNVFHHTYPNIDGVDDDIAVIPLARMAPTQPYHWAYRLQWIYMFPMYGLLAVKWHFIDDYRALASGKIAGNRFPRPRGAELFGLFAGKLMWTMWMFGLPLLILPWQSALVFYISSELTLGLFLAVVFQLAHCVEGADFAELPAKGEELQLDFAEHQLRTAVDFARGNRFVTWYVGGLNYQVVHHLFPKICHVHYPDLSAILEEVAGKHGLPYKINESFGAALASHVRFLYQMGHPEPVPAPATV